MFVHQSFLVNFLSTFYQECHEFFIISLNIFCSCLPAHIFLNFVVWYKLKVTRLFDIYSLFCLQDLTFIPYFEDRYPAILNEASSDTEADDSHVISNDVYDKKINSSKMCPPSPQKKYCKRTRGPLIMEISDVTKRTKN